MARVELVHSSAVGVTGQPNDCVDLVRGASGGLAAVEMIGGGFGIGRYRKEEGREDGGRGNGDAANVEIWFIRAPIDRTSRRPASRINPILI